MSRAIDRQNSEDEFSFDSVFASPTINGTVKLPCDNEGNSPPALDIGGNSPPLSSTDSSPILPGTSPLPPGVTEITDKISQLDIGTAESASAVQSPSSQGSVALDDFELLHVIGRGSYGKVMCVRRKGIGNGIYALKVLKKSQVLSGKSVKYVWAERSAMTKVHLIDRPHLFSNTLPFYPSSPCAAILMLLPP